MKRYKLVLLLVLVITVKANAFNWKKCAPTFIAGNGAGSVLSTTSYLSSTGDCAMIGMNEHDKKVFIAQNSLELMLDSAKGEGKYLKTYAEMNGCDILSYSKEIHQNYSDIFISRSPETIHKNLEKYSCLKAI